MSKGETRYQFKLSHIADKISLRSHRTIRACLAEFFGTIILILFGCGVIAQVVLGDLGNKMHGGFLAITLGWGMAVMIAVFFSGAGGPGLVNPAVTLAHMILGKVHPKQGGLYILCQILGGWIGALALFGIYREKILLYAKTHDNGTLLLATTGSIFVTNPGASHLTCFLDQVAGTALLAAGALAITNQKAWPMPGYLHPLFVGLLVYALVGTFALNAGCALNPARDFGPRLMLLMCGWGTQAFTGANYYFWIPIFGPIVGAIVGALLYELTIGVHLDEPETE